MKGKFLLVGLVFLLACAVVGCANEPALTKGEQPNIDEQKAPLRIHQTLPSGASSVTVESVSLLTEEEVISYIQVYGVSTLVSQQGTSFNPVGQWATVYEESSKSWKVQGAVVTNYKGYDYYYSTTWTYDTYGVKLLSIKL